MVKVKHHMHTRRKITPKLSYQKMQILNSLKNFEPELALLVGLQVLSSKGGEGELFDKILLA